MTFNFQYLAACLALWFINSAQANLCHCDDRLFICTLNNLTSIPTKFTCQKNIIRSVTVTMDKNQVFNTKNFRTIVLKKNKITLQNSNAFRFPSKVQFLDISDNSIERLESRVFSGLGQLTLLNLTENRIKSLESDAFANLLSLHELFLCRNQLSSISREVLRPLINLTVLRLDHNSIISLSYGNFRLMPQLVKLNIANNQIRKLEKYNFEGLISLEILNLSNNKIQSIDREISQSINCRPESLSGHFRIGDQEHCFDYLSKLKVLDLSNNYLSTLNAPTFLCIKSLTKLLVIGNPLKCKNCRVKHFFEYVCEKQDLCGNENKCQKTHISRQARRRLKKNKAKKLEKKRIKEKLKKLQQTKNTTSQESMDLNVNFPTETSNLRISQSPQSLTSNCVLSKSFSKHPSTYKDMEIVLWLIVSSVIAGTSAMLMCITTFTICSNCKKKSHQISQKNITGIIGDFKRKPFNSANCNHLASRPLPQEPKLYEDSLLLN